MLLFNCFVLLNAVALINCDVFKLGYLTGSVRRPGDFEYERPGEFYQLFKRKFASTGTHLCEQDLISFMKPHE